MSQINSLPVSEQEIIYPCPFSKGYGMPAGQAWQLLKIYYIYRFILSSSLCLMLYFRHAPTFLNSFESNLYFYTSLSYAALTVWLGLCIFFRWLQYAALAQLLIFTDILTLTLIMHASGGIASGIGILIAVAVAAGGLLIGGRCAIVFAAIASLLVLSTEIYSNYKSLNLQSNYSISGMLGASYFAIALLSMIMAKRSEQMLTLTDRQKQTIIQLEELNRYIIQHLQSGLIIIDAHEKIILMNRAALRLTQLASPAGQLDHISSLLSKTFQAWRRAKEFNMVMLKFDSDSEIQCQFTVMQTYFQDYYLITLEDTALYNQRVQQSKLASLGRLTASIAHEIRNPLGAISHAGQLLSENPQLSNQDQRLTGIVLTNARRVNQIIEDILSLSKRTDSNRKKINLAQWLGYYLENFYIENSTASGFKLMLPEKDLQGLIDPAHLKQILDNLCQNALRYGCPEQGDIVIQVSASAYGPCIDVIDHGPGVAQEHIGQLFEPFFTTSSQGTGLGLFISRELAELNQAKLSYHLADNQKSCFRLCLADANQITIEI